MKKYYFDNSIITPAILAYQKNHDSSLLEPFTTHFETLIRGIINTHKIYRFWSDQDELIQQGFVVIYEALSRFDINKGDLFSYLSIALKQALKNWTIAQNAAIAKGVELKEDATEQIEPMVWDVINITHAADLTEEEEKICKDLDCALNQHKLSNYPDMMDYLQGHGWTYQQIMGTLNHLKEAYARRNN